jgi:hypothetical protein
VATALVREHGYDRADARELADGLADADLDRAADDRGVGAPPAGADRDGGILSWFAAHADQIRALVELIVSLFVGKGPAAPG